MVVIVLGFLALRSTISSFFNIIHRKVSTLRDHKTSRIVLPDEKFFDGYQRTSHREEQFRDQSYLGTTQYLIDIPLDKVLYLGWIIQIRTNSHKFKKDKNT
jgi:hypothetical protein